MRRKSYDTLPCLMTLLVQVFGPLPWAGIRCVHSTACSQTGLGSGAGKKDNKLAKQKAQGAKTGSAGEAAWCCAAWHVRLSSSASILSLRLQLGSSRWIIAHQLPLRRPAVF